MMDALAERLRSILAPSSVLAGADIEPRYASDAGGKYTTSPALVVLPSSTEEVAYVLREANAAGCPVTVQGGRTGLVGGAIPSSGGIALSLERMNRIHEVDPLTMSMVADAGVILQHAHEAAEAIGCILPLDLGARGSATIGGNIATNAGGLRVLRWGTMRDMVLGIEAVLADGTIIETSIRSIKDNAGYHWKDLVIGSEGTLAIVTKAILRLRPAPVGTQTALIAAEDFAGAVSVLRQLDADLAGTLSSFELMWPRFYDYVTGVHLPRRARPLPLGAGCYAIVEAMGADPERDAERFEAALARALERGAASDVVIAQSDRERTAIWALREELAEPFRLLQPYVLFDVSMALGDMPAFAMGVEQAIAARFPGATVLIYGHAGDGNLHLVIHVGDGSEEAEHAVHVAVFDVLRSVGGSISAEHGIGLAKRPYLGWTRSEAEIALMRRLKQAFDPRGILNPGKIFE